MTDDEKFEAIMQAEWDQDEYQKLELNTKVRIDLSYLHESDFYNLPMDYLIEHGHGQKGVIQDVWKDVDGFYLYHVACEDRIVRGAYAREDLVKI